MFPAASDHVFFYACVFQGMLVEGPAGPEGPTVSHSASSSVAPVYFPPSPLPVSLSSVILGNPCR